MAPLIVAHRGDSSRFPENTLAAFQGALVAGADLIELDVQLTRDDVVVVLHDHTLERTTSGAGSVRDRAYPDIQALSAHYPRRFGEAFRGERIPTLGEVLAVVRGRLGVLVEIKMESIDPTGTIERETVRAIRGARMEKEASIVSFVPEALERSLKLAPEIERGLIFGEGDVAGVLRAAAAARCSLVMPEKAMLGAPLCDAARAEGLRVVTWVIDEPEEFRRLAPLDLYGVCSNAPGLLVEAVWESE